MARTNIDIDEDLVTEVMRRYRLSSRRAAVDLPFAGSLASR